MRKEERPNTDHYVCTTCSSWTKHVYTVVDNSATTLLAVC